MSIPTTVEHIKKNLPEIYEVMKTLFITKHSKSKKKDVLSSNIDDCEWSFHTAQRIQGFNFNDLLNGKHSAPVEQKTPEEVTHKLFESDDLYVSIEAKQKTIIVTHEFPKFNDPQFYIPQEIVDSYDTNEKPDVLSNPTIFVYLNNILKENYVLGGLKNIKTNEQFIILQHEKRTANVYRICDIDNNLEMVSSYMFDFVKTLNFETPTEIKIEKTKYETIPVVDSLALLNGKTEWIEDVDSTICCLSGMLSGEPGFFQVGQIQTSRVSQIPSNTVKEYLLPAPNSNELKKKFKIR